VRADVIPYLIGGTQEVRASATSVVTSMTQAQLADALLSESPPSLEGVLTPEVLASLTRFKGASDTLESCFKLGVAIPGNRKYGSTVSDATLDCTAIAAVAGAGAAAVLAEAFKSESVQTVVGAIVQVFVPGYGGGGGGSTTDPGDTGGGGTADHSWHLGTQSAGAVTYAADAPYAWTPGQMLCQVQMTDPDTGEPMTVELDGKQLRHIIEDHLQSSPDTEKGIWDYYFRQGVSDDDLADFVRETYPENFQNLIEFICGQLGTLTPAGWGDSTEDGADTRVFDYLYTDVASIGTPKANSLKKDLPYFTVIVAPDGRIVSSYPGYTEYE
jgi:hypothetical protein